MAPGDTASNSPVLIVHRAAHEIGGNCIEISFAGHRILLDAGTPLEAPSPEDSNPVPESLDTTQPVDAVIVSHPHQDHHGLLRRLPESWPVWCGAPTESLMRLTMGLTGNAIPQTNVSCYASFRPFEVGPFKITAFLTDHSAFDAHMLLVEVGGKSILYSGDFRRTGRKAALVDRMLKSPLQVLMSSCWRELPLGGRVDFQPRQTLRRSSSRFFEKRRGAYSLLGRPRTSTEPSPSTGRANRRSAPWFSFSTRLMCSSGWGNTTTACLRWAASTTRGCHLRHQADVREPRADEQGCVHRAMLHIVLLQCGRWGCRGACRVEASTRPLPPG